MDRSNTYFTVFFPPPPPPSFVCVCVIVCLFLHHINRTTGRLTNECVSGRVLCVVCCVVYLLSLLITPGAVQTKDFFFCLVDEADSILIDEARTPLIISRSVDAPAQKFATAQKIASVLEKGVHYTVRAEILLLVLLLFTHLKHLCRPWCTACCSPRGERRGERKERRK